MEIRNARERRLLWLAVGASLLLHAAVLFIGPPNVQPSEPSGKGHAQPPRLLATLASPATSPPTQPRSRRPPRAAAKEKAARPPTAKAPPSAAKPRQLSVPSAEPAKRTWTAAERADMNKFLDELSAEAKPPSGRELAQKGLAMARQMHSPENDQGEDPATLTVNKGNGVDPYSLELYFESLMRKMNRSAAFVANDPHRRRGSRKALVEISINADGSLKSYRVLRSADQADEIAFVKSVIDRASPFSAFPRDIRRVGASLSILMCILPSGAGGGGFSRSFGDQDCRD